MLTLYASAAEGSVLALERTNSVISVIISLRVSFTWHLQGSIAMLFDRRAEFRVSYTHLASPYRIR